KRTNAPDSNNPTTDKKAFVASHFAIYSILLMFPWTWSPNLRFLSKKQMIYSLFSKLYDCRTIWDHFNTYSSLA
ncbi:unnamed protein product, partial [Aphanomyces euteiches]